MYDLYCGLGGWAEGFLSQGYECVGFDIEAHDYGTGGYPGNLILRDVRSIHGSELKDAACIVGSSPCQEFSYRAMPWKRAKALPPPYLGIELFNAQFRIQREASEAAGHHIPMVVENVRGAQKWVGRSQWHYGSFHLWGDVPALMPIAKSIKVPGIRFDDSGRSFQSASAEGLKWGDCKGKIFSERTHSSMEAAIGAHREGSKNNGGSWFNIAHNTTSGHGRNPDGRKHDCSGWDEKGSLASHNRLVSNQTIGIKQRGSGAAWWDKALDERRKEATAIKNGGDWFSSGENCSLQRRQSSKGSSRKAASAFIAKIPFPLSQHIARAFTQVPA